MEAYSTGDLQLKRPIPERKRKFSTPLETSTYMNLKTNSGIQFIWDVNTVVGRVVPSVWKEHNAFGFNDPNFCLSAFH
jgi:hypothetical protein